MTGRAWRTRSRSLGGCGVWSGVAVVYFADAEPITAWARDPEHRVAKQRGREEWYSHYMIRICRVEREYGRPDR